MVSLLAQAAPSVADQAREILQRYGVEQYVVAGLSLVIGLLLTFIARRAIGSFAVKHHLSTLMIRPVKTLIFWLGLLLSIGVAVEQFGIHLLSSLAAMLALMAIGFVAVWSVLSNALCSLLLVLFRPFDLDDFVEFPGEEIQGRVKDLNILYTILETADGALYQVPNNVFFQKTIKRIPGASHGNLSIKTEVPETEGKGKD